MRFALRIANCGLRIADYSFCLNSRTQPSVSRPRLAGSSDTGGAGGKGVDARATGSR